MVIYLCMSNVLLIFVLLEWLAWLGRVGRVYSNQPYTQIF